MPISQPSVLAAALAVLMAAFLMPTGSPVVFSQEAGPWGTLTGKIIVTGDRPENKTEDVGDNKDKAVCLVDGELPQDDKFTIDDDGGLRDVFVMMYRKSSDPEVPIHESYDAAMAEPVTIDNEKCRFVPQASFVRVGQTLVLKNSDPVGHNCHITGFKNEFNTTIPANNSVEVVPQAEEKVPIPVRCDLHKWMDGVLMIRENPYVAISSSDGSFTIENVPAGEWQFQFWHKGGAYLRDLVVPDQKVGRRGEIDVTIAAGETTDLGTLELPGESLDK